MSDSTLERSAPLKAVLKIEQSLLDGREKGIPSGASAFPLCDIELQGWNVLREDLPLPLALLKQSALDQNSAWMSAFLRHSGAMIAPHGKTTMSPQLFQRQLDDGAWGITVATVQQVRTCRDYGVQRIILANQLLGKTSIQYVLEEMRKDPEFDFYCLVDSLASVQVLADALRSDPLGRPLQLLVEIGFEGGRTGARCLETAERIARLVKDNEPFLVLRGVAGFEGLMPGSSHSEIEARVVGFFDSITRLAESCEAAALFHAGPVILSAGGSAFYDLAVKRFARAELKSDVYIVVRSGCYLTHDSKLYEDQFPRLIERSPELAALGDGPRAALEVWAYVQSRPEPGRAILTLGKRDCSYDAGLPLPLQWFRPGKHAGPRPLPDGYRLIDMNDQHAFLEVPADSSLEFGDMVMLGISHPCTTFDKWKVLQVVTDEYDVVGAIRTFF